MDIPDQIHFDALDPEDFELQHWLATEESENLWQVSTLIEQRLKKEKKELEHLLRANCHVVYDLAPCRTRLENGHTLLNMIRMQLGTRRPDCEMRAFKMEASHDIFVCITSNSRWGRRSKRIN